jgi:hypothetical protein
VSPIADDPSIAFGMPFLLHSILTGACALFLFAITGLAALRALGFWRNSIRVPSADILLMAPAVGMGVFLPISLVFTTLLRFSTGSVLLCWALTSATMWLLARRRPVDPLLDEVDAAADTPRRITIAATIVLILGAALAALVPTIQVYPFILHGGLYVFSPTADHVKVAFTDAIARGGLPLKNPLYAPRGDRILLSYSYGWYVLAAEIKKLSHSTGWQAEVALTWFTSFAVIGFLSAQACRLCCKARAGIWLILLFLVGPLSSDLLPLVLGDHWLALVGLPSTHGLELPWLQLAWAPQHAFSALAVVVLIWLMSIVMATPTIHWRFALAIGLITAAGFESSIWVGGVALAAAAPLLIIAALALRMSSRQYLRLGLTVGTATLICIVSIIPLLIGLKSGTSSFGDKPPIGLAVFPSTLLEDHLGLTGSAKTAARIVLYWIHLLPLSFGAIYLIGLPAMFLWRPQSLAQRTLHAMALAATVSFLLVSQFIRSTILANDLGWRAVNVPVMLMLVWAAIAITSLLDRSDLAPVKWRLLGCVAKLRDVAISCAIGILTLGLFATVRLVAQPIPILPAEAEEHRLFAQQAWAWEIVRRYTKPTDLVQASPDAFPDVTPWPISLPYHLMADRATAFACLGTGRAYAFRYPAIDANRQYHLIHDAFVAQPKPKTLQTLHDQLHIMAIVVTPQDGIWPTQVIEQSGLYRCVAATESYKVYVAEKLKKHS